MYIIYTYIIYIYQRLPRWFSGKESACNAGDTKDADLIPRSGRSPEVGNGNVLWYYLGNPMGRRAWKATIHGIAKSWM